MNHMINLQFVFCFLSNTLLTFFPSYQTSHMRSEVGDDSCDFRAACLFSSCFSFKAEEEEEKTPLPFPLLGCDQKAVTDTAGVPDKSFMCLSDSLFLLVAEAPIETEIQVK